ncbi:MAG: HdeD family acid-resistance protein [Bacteroidota bacterium]
MTTQFFKMVKSSIKYWYVPLIIGILFIGVGIWVFATPLESFLTLSLLFSISFLFAGGSEVFFALSNRKEMDNWGWVLFSGILNLLIGMVLVSQPEISIVTLPLYVGFVILFRSIQSIIIAYDLKNYGIMDWGNMAIIGVLGTVFGFILIWNPVFAGFSLVFWMGIAFIISGATAIYYAIELRKLRSLPEQVSEELKDRFEEVKAEIQQQLKRK